MGIKIKDNRIKPKYNGKNKQKITIHDKIFLEWLQHQDYRCFVCGKQNGIEWHHVKLNSSDRKNHNRLIPLCGVEHHRLGDLSPHGNPKKWRKTFKIDLQNTFADEIYQTFLTKLT